MDNKQLRRCWEQIWCQYVQIRLWVGSNKHIHDYGNLCFLQRPSNDGTIMRLASIFLHSDIILTPYPPVTKLCNPNSTICTYLFYHKNMFLLFPLWNIICNKKHAGFFPSFLAFTEFNPVALCSDLGVKFASCCTVDNLTCHPLTSHIGKSKVTQTLSQHDFFTKQNVKNPQFLQDWPSHPSIWGTVFLELPPSESHHCNPRKMNPVGQ